MFALVNNNTAQLLEGQPFEVGDVQYPGNIVYLWPAEDLAAIGVYPIAEPPPPPQGQVETSRSLTVTDGMPTWDVVHGPPPVPAKVHKYWLTKVLEAMGEMDDIEDTLDAMALGGNRGPRREWLTATEVERTNQMVNEFAASRGYTPEQVDQMFIQAAAYQAASQA